MIRRLRVRDVWEVLPNDVHGATAMRLAKIEPAVQIVLRGPSRPASLIAQCGAYKYTIHVEENAATSISTGNVTGMAVEFKLAVIFIASG